MKKFFLVLLAACAAALAAGCDGQRMCGGDEGLGTEESECSLGEGGTGGDGGVSGEFRDDAGICRSDSWEAFDCPPTYEIALVTERCGGAGPACGGSCGKWLVVQDSCTPSLGCTYDPVSRALVGVVYGDDVRTHCGDTSYEVTYGDGYHGCAFQDLIVDRACWLKGQ